MSKSTRKIRLLTQQTNLTKTIEDFINNCNVRNLSHYTIENYISVLKIFAELVNNKKIEDITGADINNYILYMKKQGNSNITIVGKLRVIKALFSYANIDIEIPKIQKEYNIKQPYTEEEVKKLLKKPTRNSYVEWRNHAMVSLLLATGIRRRTLINLRISDLDFTHNTIYLNQTKTRKKYYLPMSNELKQTIKHYLNLYEHDDDDYLFVNQYGEQLTNTAVKQAIRDYNVRRGVTKTSMHLFRHTFAINYLRNGGNIMYLKEILGHSDIQTTQKYLKVTVDDLQNNFDDFCPLDNFKRKGIKIKKK